MQSRFTIPFSRLIMALFALGLTGTAIALFWITYVGSLSIAEHEIARTAKSRAALARLVYTQHLDKLESQLRKIAAQPRLREAMVAQDAVTAAHIANTATEGLNSAALDILLIDLPHHPEWVNTSLGLIDISHQLPIKIRNALPPDVWLTYANHHDQPAMVTAILSILVLDRDSGETIGRIVGGTTLTDSFYMAGAMAAALEAENLGFYHNGKVIAGLGDLISETLPETLTTADQVGSQLKGDSLYIFAPLTRSLDGHRLSIVIKQPVDTLKNVAETFSRLFPPFLIYTLILAIAAALLTNRATSAGLRKLMNYASGLRQDEVVSPPPPGLIREFNQLASMFQTAFEAARDRDAQFRDLIDGSLQGVVVHINQRVIYANDALLNILGYGQQDLIGVSIFRVYAEDEQERMQSYHALRESGGAPRSYVVKGRHKDHQEIWLEQHVRIIDWHGEQAYYVTITDITERKRQEELADKNANYDLLTGLPNRRLLMDRLAQTVQHLHQAATCAIMVIDLDRLKTVNEIYGPKTGDFVIAETAGRLTELLGTDQTVARIGADEFAAIVTNREDRWDIENAAREILDAISAPISAPDDSRIIMSASIGITLAPADGVDEEALLIQADTSMYQAKLDAGPSYRFYSSQMYAANARAGQIEAALREALENRELQLHYQPIVDYKRGTLSMCEALARWSTPELGPVSPTEFIRVAEDTGLIVPLGEWVLEEACMFFRSCNRNGLHLDGISVNISPRQCREPGFVDKLAHILDKHEMLPGCLHLEITENIMLDHQHADPTGVLKAITALGVKISLDDFGTGYSWLSYLKRLPIDTLKIDRSFIKGLERDADGQALVSAIVSMANSLGLEVICEGAETREQCDLIVDLGCSLIQGFSVARPMSGTDFHQFLAHHMGAKPVAAASR